MILLGAVAMGAATLGGEISDKFMQIAGTVATAQIPTLSTQGG